MKKRILGLFAAVLLVFITTCSKDGAGKTVTIDLWYGAAVTEAGPPPADWKVL